MIKKLLVLVLVGVVVVAGALGYTRGQVVSYVNQDLLFDEAQLVTIEPGLSFQGLLTRFENQGWIEANPLSKFARRLHPELTQLKAGTFLLEPEQTLKQGLSALVNGQQAQFSITFVEGSTFKEWRTQLEQAPHLTHLTSQMSESDIAASLSVEQSKLEGLLLAETYQYTVGMSDLDILKRANKSLMNKLGQLWDTRQAKLPLKNDYEALILASIIEKETAVAAERPLVSSVFINRLNRGMRLQTDPTVIYGMGDSYNGNIRKRDLQTPTPYNTYTIDGLPPTPIAMVGEDAIAAALNPQKSSYLYFVASGEGGHVFSKNLRDHNKAVQAYLKKLRARK